MTWVLDGNSRLSVCHGRHNAITTKSPDRRLVLLELTQLAESGSILTALRLARPVGKAVLALQTMPQTSCTDVLPRQVAFYLGLPTVLTCGSKFRCITPGIGAVIGLSKHRGQKGSGIWKDYQKMILLLCLEPRIWRYLSGEIDNAGAISA